MQIIAKAVDAAVSDMRMDKEFCETDFGGHVNNNVPSRADYTTPCNAYQYGLPLTPILCL